MPFNFFETTKEKQNAYFLSAATIAAGLFLISNPGGWLVAGMAGAFIGGGTSGVLYTAKTPDEEFNEDEFFRQATVGGVGGLLSGGIGAGASIPALLTGGAVGGIGSKTAETLTKLNRLPTCKEILEQGSIGLVSAGIGASASKIAGNIVGEAGDDIIAHFFKGGVEGAAGGMAGKVVDNVGHNLTHDEPSDKKELFDGVGPAMLQGSLIGGLVAASKQAAKTQNNRAEVSNEADNHSQESETPDNSPTEGKTEDIQTPDNQITIIPPSHPKAVIDALSHEMKKGFQPTDNALKNSPINIIEQVNMGEHVTLKHHSERIKIYRDGNAIVFKYHHDDKVRYNAPINRVTPENPPSNPQGNTLPENAPETLSAPGHFPSTAPSPKGMKVIFFSRPLEGPTGVGALLFGKARHVGFIIDHPEYGLVLFENTGKPHEGSSFRAIKIEEYHAQTNASKGRWIYEVGVTDLSLEEISQLAFDWIAKFPDYKWYSDNCRRFVNEILRKMLPSAEHLDFSINHSDFKKNPCKAIESLIRDGGFNVSKHLQSVNETSNSSGKIIPQYCFS